MKPGSYAAIILALCLVSAVTGFSQKGDSKPKISGQNPSPLSASKGTPITIELSNLIVSDPDPSPVYPDGFSLEVSNGKNYKVQGATVTPDKNFEGKLSVPVRVSDGKNHSDMFNFQIDVVGTQNTAPRITGQTPLSITQGNTLTIEFSQLQVTDPDNNYPTDFTLKVFDSNNYSVNGNTITPSANFTGNLKIPVTVNDGQRESNRFDLKVGVTKSQNIAPRITDQSPLSINQGNTLTIEFSQLQVTDPDNNYPTGFTLKVFDDNNYNVNGNTITPSPNFTGNLKVPVSVNDGQKESNRFDLKVEVKKVQNIAPRITGQLPLQTNQNKAIPILLSHLIVEDPDNHYPDGFTLKILNGEHYSFGSNIVNPAPGFIGKLNVGVVVNDGKATSAEYKLKIDVLAVIVNSAPVITGQKLISITQGTPFTIQLSHLLVSDRDDEYPTGFTLKVLAGTDYALSGSTVTPNANITNQTIAVSVSVNDGQNDSQPYALQIQVTPLTSRPKINGQKELTVMEDNTIVINLSDLIVTDADNPGYPKGFTLTILPANGDAYSVNGNSVTPALNLNGFLEVRITVSDGVYISDIFKLAILILPVNDPPELAGFETESLAYVPGHDPVPLSEFVDVKDVDGDHLIFAEIGFRLKNFNPLNDVLTFSDTISKIRAVFDPDGKLFLIGYATNTEYRDALRSIRYSYRLTQDENGNPDDIVFGTRTIYVSVFDGQLMSRAFEREINIEGNLALLIPNAFTPNGDTVNDTWKLNIANSDGANNAIIRVYDRRGNLLYESTGFEKAWDGISNGQLLPVDTYYYTIDFNLSYMKKTYKGAVSLLH